MLDLTLEQGAAVSADEMVARIAQGDPAMERLFVQRYRRGVTLLVRRHCRPNDPDVPDLIQDVLTNVLQRLRDGAVRDAAALPGYLQVSVARITAAEYRRRGRRAQVPVDDEEPDRAEHGGDVATELDEARRDRLVRELIERLPTPRDREVLRRFYLDEQSKVEVCSSLGIDADHFHRVVFRARQRLKELLAGAGIRSATEGGTAGETAIAQETPT